MKGREIEGSGERRQIQELDRRWRGIETTVVRGGGRHDTNVLDQRTEGAIESKVGNGRERQKSELGWSGGEYPRG